MDEETNKAEAARTQRVERWRALSPEDRANARMRHGSFSHDMNSYLQVLAAETNPTDPPDAWEEEAR